MRFNHFVLAAILVMALASFGIARANGLGVGILKVEPAYNISKNKLFLSTQSSIFFKDVVHHNSDGSAYGMSYWDIQGGASLYYGLTNYFQLAVQQIIYQDNHKEGVGYNLPDDLTFQAKVGSLGSENHSTRFGLRLDVTLPLAEYYNVPLEPYSAGRIVVGLTGLFSIGSEPDISDHGVNVNANIGFFNHNDMGIRFTESPADTFSLLKNTTEMVYGLGFVSNHAEFSFFAELFGRSFIRKPLMTAYTRENMLYFSPGLSYAVKSWLRLSVALDLRLLGDKDETLYTIDSNVLTKPLDGAPNLPAWRMKVGAAIALNGHPVPIKDESGLLEPVESESKNVPEQAPPAKLAPQYKELAEQKRSTEDVEAELERIHNERKRMEDLLGRLRNILEKPVGKKK